MPLRVALGLDQGKEKLERPDEIEACGDMIQGSMSW